VFLGIFVNTDPRLYFNK